MRVTPPERAEMDGILLGDDGSMIFVARLRAESRASLGGRRGGRWLGVALGLAVTVLLLSSCGLPKKTRNLFGGKTQMEVAVSPQLNGNAPVAVEVVVFYEKAVFQQASALTARQWFQQREQILRDNPKQIDAWKWEWVPAQEVPAQTLNFRLGAAGALIFADYFEPGEHRVRFDPHEHFRLLLGESSFSITPLKRT
jgi:type VI secretion system protein